MINNDLSKADINKITRLNEALWKLKSGEQRYFPITKLTSIKSLCKEETIRRRYCSHLFFLVKTRLQTMTAKSIEEQEILEAIEKIANIINDYSGDETAEEALRQCKFKLVDYQNDFKKIHWGAVRLIKNMDFLVIEKIILCLITENEYAQGMIYSATRDYVEAYCPSTGTGLIAASAPMLEQVLKFWNGLVSNDALKENEGIAPPW